MLAGLRTGVNEIPRREGRPIKFWMAVAYYLSPGMAARLIEVVDSIRKKTLRSPDNWWNLFVTHCA